MQNRQESTLKINNHQHLKVNQRLIQAPQSIWAKDLMNMKEVVKKVMSHILMMNKDALKEVVRKRRYRKTLYRSRDSSRVSSLSLTQVAGLNQDKPKHESSDHPADNPDNQ